MRPVAEAWTQAHPEQVVLFRRVFCGHAGQRWGHRCYDEADSEAISEWVRRVVARGPVSRARNGRWVRHVYGR